MHSPHFDYLAKRRLQRYRFDFQYQMIYGRILVLHSLYQEMPIVIVFWPRFPDWLSFQNRPPYNPH